MRHIFLFCFLFANTVFAVDDFIENEASHRTQMLSNQGTQFVSDEMIFLHGITSVEKSHSIFFYEPPSDAHSGFFPLCEFPVNPMFELTDRCGSPRSCASQELDEAEDKEMEYYATRLEREFYSYVSALDTSMRNKFCPIIWGLPIQKSEKKFQQKAQSQREFRVIRYETPVDKVKHKKCCSVM